MATIPSKPSDIVTTTPADTDSSKDTASAIRSKASATQALITWLQAVIGSVSTGENDIVTRLFKNKVSATDTTENYLQAKLVAGTNITITKNNSGADETLTFSAIAGDFCTLEGSETLTNKTITNPKGTIYTPDSQSGIFTPTFVSHDFISFTLSGNITLANPSTYSYGTTKQILLKQDATGGRTITFGTFYKFANGADKTLSTAPNAIDILTISFIGDGDFAYCTLLKAFS